MREAVSAEIWGFFGGQCETQDQLPLIIAGQQLGHYPLTVLVDGSGTQFSPDNTEPDREFELTARGTSDTRLSMVEGGTMMSAMVVEGPSQELEILGPQGLLTLVEVIQPEDVDRLEVEFFLDRKSADLFVDGNTIGALPGTRILASSRVYFGEREICGDIDPKHFVIESVTPEVCPSSSQGLWAEVVGEGECRLRYGVRGLGGAELVSEIAVFFADLE